MRRSIATLAVASLITVLSVAVAFAAPTAVNVRIEGREETLFERPILTEGHDVEASSDTKARSCDGINPNDPENLTPGPTPTAAAVDAMGAVGETFDGRWYAGYEDYLLTRWGPDKEAEGESWSLFVNDVLLDVGGCQYELSEGGEVLWAYGTPVHKPLLALYPEGSTSGAPPLTASAKLNEPFTVEVDAYANVKEGKPPPTPERAGSSPYPGADVSPVQTATNGFEKVETEDPSTVRTDAQGKASITFTTTGWHRIKASAAGAVRSNRLDVCVPPEGGSGCGQPPAEDRTPAPPTAPEPEGKQEPGPGPGLISEASSGQQRVPLATAGAGTPAGSNAPNGATPLPAGELHLDGLVLTPLDDRAAAIHYRGHWRRAASAGAWRGTLTIGTAGASLAVHLARGRPVFIVGGAHQHARVEVRAGTRREISLIADSHAGASRLLIGAGRLRAGTVWLRVLNGTVAIDGVAVLP